MPNRLSAPASALLLWCSAIGCGEDTSGEATPTHVRVVVDGDFPLLNLTWVDVAVDWGSDCTSERWLALSTPVPPQVGDMTGNTFASFPMSFDVLPQNEASEENVTLFVAGVGAYGAVAVDSRTVQFKPGERVTVELFLSNPCAPISCNHTYDDASEGDVEDIENWCSLPTAQLQSFRPFPCTCGAL